MLFKEATEDLNITATDWDKMNPIMPEPEVGKIYHGFDDGKIRLSRLIDWKITKRIDLDNDKVSKHLLKVLQRDIKECYWVFDTEQTIIFHAKAVDKDGKYDKDECIISECSSKLGQLEDIEEELGIDLITLINILINIFDKGFYISIHAFGSKERYTFHNDARYMKLSIASKSLILYHYAWSDEEYTEYYFKDYGKTWALTKEELEND